MDFNTININNFPGFFVVLDLSSRFLAANNTALQWIGFKSRDLMMGKTYCDMPCKASEQHDNFVLQDRLILNQHKGYGKIIGLYCYNNNEWKVIVAEKYPLKNEQSETVALACHMTDLTHTNIIDVTKFVKLINFSKNKNYPTEQSGFLISNYPQKYALTRRQEECLFFLIRGKTLKEISEVLSISTRTVEQFVEQLKNIFVCNTKSELIENAVHRGYMGVIPKSFFQTI